MAESHQTPWYATTFGGFEMSGAAGSVRFRTKKTASLAALLAVRPGRSIRRDTLAALFWPESSQDAARQSLRMALSDVRSALGESAIQGDRDWVQLNPDHVDSDCARFERLVAAGDSAEALELVRGKFLEDVEGDWVSDEWYSIQDAVGDAACAYLSKCSRSSKYAEGVKVGKRILAILGCREDLHIALMKLYVAQGLPSLALAQFELLEHELDEQWGEYPSQAAVDVLESAPKARAARKNALTAEAGLVIGRDELLSQVAGLLTAKDGPRQITLIGPGGSGKTSLARRILEELGEAIPNWFVDLTAETEREAAVRRIQTALGLRHGELSEAVPAIARHLEGRPGLLVLDNYEQLASSAAPLVGELIGLAPSVRILVTSRVALQAQDERLIQVGPLALPPAGATLEEVRNAPAVELFERQACQANSRFSVSASNAPAVIQLCRQLDGLPLALELAAARVIVRSPAQILSSLRLSLDSIASRVRHADAEAEPIAFSETDREVRHGSLTRTIAWSFDLLSPAEREVCLAASLFAGRFTEADVQAVVPHVDAGEALGELVSASMVNAETAGDEAQCWMFETLRQFMKETLDGTELERDLWTRFLKEMARRADAIEQDGTLDRTKRMTQHWRLMPNTMAAIQFGTETSIEPDLTAGLVLNLYRTASTYGVTQQLAAQADAIRHWPRGTLSDVRLAQICDAWVILTANSAAIEDQLNVIQEAIELAGKDVQTVAQLKLTRGSLFKQMGRYDEAAPDLDWAFHNLPLARHDLRAKALYESGLTLCCIAKYEEALDRHLAALSEARKGGDPNLLIRILFDVGSEMAHLGQGEASMEYFEEAIERCLKLDSRKMEGLTRWQQGDAYLSMGKPFEALAALKKAINLVVEAGFSAGLKWVFLDTGEALQGCDNPVLAARVLGKAVETRIAENRPLAAYEQEDLDRVRVSIRARIGDAAFDRHWADGFAEDWGVLMREVQEFVPAKPPDG